MKDPKKPGLKKALKAIFLAAVLGTAAGGLESLPQDPQTDVNFTINEHQINIRPSDQFWNATLGIKSQAQLEKDLIAAAKDGDSWRVDILISKYDVSAHILADEPLMVAAEKGHLDVVKKLLAYGANPNARSGYALDLAMEKGHRAVADTLINAGANINANNGALLTDAVATGNLQNIFYLVTKGADLNANSTEALNTAIRMNDLAVTSFLIVNGANPRAINSESWVLVKDLGYTEMNTYLETVYAESTRELMLGAAAVRDAAAATPTATPHAAGAWNTPPRPMPPATPPTPPDYIDQFYNGF